MTLAKGGSNPPPTTPRPPNPQQVAQQPSGFAKADAGKPRYSLVPPRALASVVDVLEAGAKKYAPGNWARCPADERIRYYDAAIRHLEAWRQGEIFDGETNLPHLAHAACCILFLLGFQVNDAPLDAGRTEGM